MSSSRDRVGCNETGCVVTHCDGTADFYPSGTSGITTAYDHAEKGGWSNSTNSGPSVSGSTYYDGCTTASNGAILAPALYGDCWTAASIVQTMSAINFSALNTLPICTAALKNINMYLGYLHSYTYEYPNDPTCISARSASCARSKSFWEAKQVEVQKKIGTLQASNPQNAALIPVVQPKSGPSACSTNAFVKSTLKGCYNGMNTLGLIPKGSPNPVTTARPQFNKILNHDDHPGAIKTGACLGGAAIGLFEQFKACQAEKQKAAQEAAKQKSERMSQFREKLISNGFKFKRS